MRKVLQSFGYSLDGFSCKTARAGEDAPADIPTEYIPGLVREGYLSQDDTAIEAREPAPLETGAAVVLDPPLAPAPAPIPITEDVTTPLVLDPHAHVETVLDAPPPPPKNRGGRPRKAR